MMTNHGPKGRWLEIAATIKTKVWVSEEDCHQHLNGEGRKPFLYGITHDSKLPHEVEYEVNEKSSYEHCGRCYNELDDDGICSDCNERNLSNIGN